ncbi:Monooxygenase, FAD-binding [Penicillium expansum]|nr:Monooxygenase, FAD-binding [Penicillium expansum]
MSRSLSVDVLIVGGGPVGLLTAYQLAQAGCSVHIVDKESKFTITQYGRANALYSRSAEFLDQLGLVDDIMQQCYIVRQSYTYGENGERIVPGRVWNFVENIEDTRFDFGIMLRQQFIEKSIRIRLEDAGVELHCPCECVNIEKADEPDADGNYVTAALRDMTTGEEYTVKSAYLVDADGGRSFVRRHLGVEFEGDTTQDKWIRVDGKVKTDLPTPRDYVSIQSANHGNILWAPLDHGVTRIGFVYNEEQELRCNGNLTEEVVVREAVAAMKPFHVEFESVDWWTLYVIGQRVASTYQPHSHIILVGDACHTHSSGAAQGLNTGIHDAVNIGWKLALVVKGKAKTALLETYSTERRAAAQRLIAFDRRISTLMGNKWPEGMDKDSYEDINAALADLFDEASGYNTGLKISYEPNLVNVVPITDYTSICVGARAPDVGLFKPGVVQPIRLQSATPNCACFYLVTFTGDPRMTLPQLSAVSITLNSAEPFNFVFSPDTVKLVTIVSADPKLSVEEGLGVPAFGTVYMDDKRRAHSRYGINLRYGALLVLRPDGHLGFAAELSVAGLEAVKAYLSKFLISDGDSSKAP